MGFFEWTLLSFMVFLILVAVAASNGRSSGSKSELEEKLREFEKENKKLRRKLYEEGSGVVVQFRDGKCVTYEGVYSSYKGSEYVVLRDFDDYVIATISRMELTHISSINAIKEVSE